MAKFPKPLVSVIVPVYNAETYLKKCLNSIIEQTLKEIEIIVVNDGSTDNSEKVVKQFQKNDERIKYFRQTNQGPSTARNIGIEKATSRYIGFVDADDWIESNMYEKLLKNAIDTNSDIVCCNAITHRKTEKKNRLNFENSIYTLNNLELFFGDFMDFKYDYANWNKLFNKDLIRRNKILFDKNIRIGEDLLFNLTCIIHSQKIACINDTLYHHNEQPDSLMHKHRNEALEGFCYINDIMPTILASRKMTSIIPIFQYKLAKIVYYSMKELIRNAKGNRSNRKILKKDIRVLNNASKILSSIKYSEYSWTEKFRIVILRLKLFRISVIIS